MSQSAEIVNLDEGLALYDDTPIYDQLRSMLWQPVRAPLAEGQPEDEANDPELPDNLDLMWLDDLRSLQKDFGRFLGYVSDQKTLVMTAVGKLKAQVDFVEDFLYIRVYGKGSQRAREAAIHTDRAYVEVNNNYLDMKAVLAALVNRMDKLTRHLDIVSRQVTIVMGNPENNPIPHHGHHEENE